MSPEKSPLWPKAIYFIYFASLACLMPFLTLYYQGLGLSGRQIGLLTAVVPLLTLISSPLWGGIADATRRYRLILLIAIAGTEVAIFLLSRSTTFTLILAAVLLYAFFLAPVVPLMDNTTLALLGGRRAEYGRLRLWGGVGWGITATLLGPILERAGLHWAFNLFLSLMLVTFAVAWLLPPVPIPPVTHHSYRAGLRILLTAPRFLLLLAIALVAGMSLSVIVNYLFLHMAALGASRTLMALSVTAATISEIPLWFIANRLLTRWGVTPMLALSLLATAVRTFVYSWMPVPWLVLPINLLHGFTFALLWTAGVAFADEIAPPGLGATAQGIFAGTSMGLGSALGAFLGGLLYDSYGLVTLFQATGALLLVAVALLALTRRLLPRPVEAVNY